jgi:hypothetical protein
MARAARSSSRRSSPEANQNAGFALVNALLPPYAIRIKDDRTVLRAVARIETLREAAIPGTWFNAPHRFRID